MTETELFIKGKLNVESEILISYIICRFKLDIMLKSQPINYYHGITPCTADCIRAVVQP